VDSGTGRAAEGSSFPWVAGGLFVVVWSTGYIAGPAGVEAVAPFSLLAIRFGFATLLLAPLAWWLRGPLRTDRATLVRVGAVGLVMNALVFGLMYVAFAAGLGATLGALLHSLSPVLTMVLAGALLRERVGPRQVIGLLVGVAGVLLVLGPEVDEAGGALGLGFALGSTLCLSLGTLGQRWVPFHLDPWWSACVQFAVCTPFLTVLALLVEGTHPVEDPLQGALAAGWLVVVNSIVGLVLLGAVVRRGGAGAASSLFFLSPPVTAVLAWLVLGETLGLREAIGLLVAVVGVALAAAADR